MPENPDDIAAALLRHPYGLFLVGSRSGDERDFMTAGWGSQCSFKPRMYAIFIEGESQTRQLIDGGGAFTINLMPADSTAVVSQFSRGAHEVGRGLDEGSYFDAPETGAPVFEGAVAWFECRVADTRPVGPHSVHRRSGGRRHPPRRGRMDHPGARLGIRRVSRPAFAGGRCRVRNCCLLQRSWRRLRPRLGHLRDHVGEHRE